MIADACKRSGIWVAVLVLPGMALRLVPLVANPLHQDEALYSFWGRLVSSGRDPWLAAVSVDKPPLALYLIAGSQAAFGASEFAARLPGLASSLLSIPLIYVLARRLYGDQGHPHFCGLVAAAVMALTPYAVLFGAVAFTDPILIFLWLAACYAAASGRWGWTGLALGLAFATKQQAVVLAPLVAGLGVGRWQVESGKCRVASRSHLRLRAVQVAAPQRGGLRSGRWQVQGGKFILGVGLVVAGVLLWDAIRVANGAAAGFWGQGVDSFGGLRLIWPAELGPRLRGWARLAGYLFGWPWLGVLLLGGVGALLWGDLTRQRRTRSALVDLTLVAFALFYLFFHLLVAFPVWDRYLLPMVPVAALLLGRVVSGRWQVTSARWRYALRITHCALLLVLLMGGGLMAAGGRIPVGGDHGAYDGLGEVVDYLWNLPAGTVLYDRWLSWHYDFYLFDACLYRAGFPSPGWLAADAAALYDGRPRYLVLPDWESSARLERMLGEVGLAMSPALTTHRRDGTVSFVVYEIGPGDGDER